MSIKIKWSIEKSVYLAEWYSREEPWHSHSLSLLLFREVLFKKTGDRRKERKFLLLFLGLVAVDETTRLY